ncbi:hypothetical protein B0H14DRAFT_2624506 [Mycena olivaceomarginata]|nr:hypothetical protein B0H14DRAFT_2624506 [Mycena olivaceomarginata]
MTLATFLSVGWLPLLSSYSSVQYISATFALRPQKVASSSSARSSKFGPYKAPLAPRPSTMTFKYGTRLRAARDFAALDAWLAENLSPDVLLVPKGVLVSQDALCVVIMSVLKGADDGVFRDPDTYSLSLHVEVEECAASPLIFLARFVGSNEDGDAPLWTRILEPRKQHYFLQRRTFAAMLVQSMSSRSISARMLLTGVRAGTRVEAAVAKYCDGIAAAEAMMARLGVFESHA